MLPIDPEREELRQTPRGDWWTDPDWLRSLALIDELGLSFDLQIHIPQMPAAVELVERFPNLQFILNHAGFPYITDDETLAAWREGMQLLAARPNIACKISGLGMADYDDSHIICVRGKSAAEIATSIQCNRDDRCLRCGSLHACVELSSRQADVLLVLTDATTVLLPSLIHENLSFPKTGSGQR